MSNALVIDASFAVRLLLPGPDQLRFREYIERWRKGSYAVCTPTLWLYEVTSSLCKGVYLGEISNMDASRALALAQQLDVRLIPPDLAQAALAFDWTLRLKRAVAYDSFYLALAETLHCELWTADQRLHNAAGLPWVCLA
jgi:predicted nucleic acid-binding protein